MAGDKNARGSDDEEASAKLKDGLESCHNVVDNYRAMLTGEVTADAAEETPPDAEIDLPA